MYLISTHVNTNGEYQDTRCQRVKIKSIKSQTIPSQKINADLFYKNYKNHKKLYLLLLHTTVIKWNGWEEINKFLKKAQNVKLLLIKLWRDSRKLQDLMLISKHHLKWKEIVLFRRARELIFYVMLSILVRRRQVPQIINQM